MMTERMVPFIRFHHAAGRREHLVQQCLPVNFG
jgi:hypothetical protein